MNEARNNPFAQAKARGDQVMQVADLGDGVGFIGIGIEPKLADDGSFAVFLVAKVAKLSGLVGVSQVGTVPLGRVFTGTVADFKKAAASALGISLPEPPTS